ncbi:hypothetical protein L1987_29246 [Smallanthus sonchifolius]|uniref:Uncharacterized protein n=1 Tax=Smallanthus sonchifolius TaxID=185202 RepID=A0ACB9HYV0_9ASTR|nr:hypothetical protein L1987_29246 [Smallanthus sonchifolius]
METTTPNTPPISPHEEAGNDNQQPPIAGLPPHASVTSPPLPIEYEDHHQEFTDSISPYSPPQQPENSADGQHPPPEEVDGQQEPPVPPSPPPEGKFVEPLETANLIQAYQEKWYSLKKGSLKAGQWEEVAITVAARCGYDEPTKTAKQCRHKLEKLRKRYRAERGKPRSKATAWNFFKLMDNLEKGPLPISSSPPMALLEYQKPSNSNGKKRKNNVDDDDGDGEFLVNKRSSRSKSYNHHVPDGYLTINLRFSDDGNRVVRGLRTPVVHKRKGFYQEDDGEDEEEEEEGGGNGNGGEEQGVAAQLAVEIKGFAEKFVKMENKKIEMIRDVERYRLEMENKRMEMILESQQMLVETVNKAFSFSSSHKTHKLSAK